MAQDHKGGDRDGNLDDDRADRQEPDFTLGLRVHRLPNPRDTDRSRPTGGKRQYRRAARFPGAPRKPAMAECAKITNSAQND